MEIEIVFPPGEYPDLVSFKTAFSAAFAEFLRLSPGCILTIRWDELTRKQHALLCDVIRYRVREEKCGGRNFLPVVKSSFRGKPCHSLKRHFLGCERQLIGIAEKMAEKDAERFVWIAAWARTARKKDGTPYSKRYILHRLELLESLGLLLPASRYRNRKWRNGFLVTHHDAVAHAEGEDCVLMPRARGYISPRQRGTRRRVVANAKTQNASQNASETSLSACKNASQNASENVSERICRSSKCPNENGLRGESERKVFTSPVSPISPTQENPVNPTPPTSRERENQSPNPDLAPMVSAAVEADATQSEMAQAKGGGQGKADQNLIPAEPWTIGGRFAHLADASVEFVVEAISEGEFDGEFLKSYQNIDALKESCVLAVRQLAERPYLEGESAALIMARVMDLLKNRGLAAPRGWYPALRRHRTWLRNPDCKNSIPASELLTHDESAIRVIDEHDCGNALARATRECPGLLAALTKIAASRGVPQTWPSALLFVEVAITEHGNVPVLLKVRDALRERCVPECAAAFESGVRKVNENS